jgi:ABC-type molybdate transport system ATPase subunit
VAHVVELLGVSHLLRRLPSGLSGGERQKVSLGRALVLEPDVLLLDEPVSAITEDERDALCLELRRIQQELSITTLHVSHSSHETGLVADRVGIMEGGRVTGIKPSRPGPSERAGT